MQRTFRISPRQGAVIAVFCLGAFVLWRVGLLPGIWDLQHYGEDSQRVAKLEREAHRMERFMAFAGKQTPEGAVLFIGSSTIERMPLETIFPGATVLNRGIGDEPAAGLMARISGADAEHNNVDWSRLAGIVVYPASVDFRRLNSSTDECVRRATRILDALAAKAPGAQVLVLGLLSQRDLDDEMRGRLNPINFQLRAACLERGFEFMGLDRAPLTDEDKGAGLGPLNRTYSKDRLHLNAAGYQVLADWIRKSDGAMSALLHP